MILEKCKALWKILVKLLGDCNPTYIAKKRFKKKLRMRCVFISTLPAYKESPVLLMGLAYFPPDLPLKYIMPLATKKNFIMV